QRNVGGAHRASREVVIQRGRLRGIEPALDRAIDQVFWMLIGGHRVGVLGACAACQVRSWRSVFFPSRRRVFTVLTDTSVESAISSTEKPSTTPNTSSPHWMG